MNSRHHQGMESTEMRRLAEGRLRGRKQTEKAPERLSEAFTLRLQHELEVHQIELEMQYEALQQAQSATEEALEKSSALFDFAPTGYFDLGIDGTILAVNLAGARLAGVDRSQLVTRRFATLVSAADRHRFGAFLEKLFREGGRGSLEVEFSRRGAKPIQILLEAVASEDGREVRAIAIDMTERHKAEAERDMLILKLQEKLEWSKNLGGVLTLCSRCKKVRNDDGQWCHLERYIADHFETTFTHSICPECTPTGRQA